jgi:hypothetical protein
VSVHTLRFDVIASRHSQVDEEAAQRVQAWTGWDLAKSRRYVEANAVVELRVLDRRPRAGVRWLATVVVTV